MKQIFLFFFTLSFICASIVGSTAFILTGTTMIGHTGLLTQILSGIISGFFISIILGISAILMLEHACAVLTLLDDE